MYIDKRTVKKYLNYKGLDSDFDSLIDDVFLEVKNISNPKKLCVKIGRASCRERV